MDNKTLLDEEKYLKKVIKEIGGKRLEKQRELNELNRKRREFSLHFADDFYYMDDEEALGEGDMLLELDTMQDNIQKQITRLNRQEYSPYFGKINFKENKKRSFKSYYIGVNNLVKNGQEIPLVCDWRAPISSLFYDYELGDAEFNTPTGTIKGNIGLKRQFNIKNKKLLKMFDSALTIGDDILKDVLSESSTKKMKTIVSSIQREQNKIIRSNYNGNMLVQGVAGSGKTSIALHRIAFLLYQNKNTLKAEDVLILSPNTLFSEYISEVLPELGEENVSQMSFYRLAEDELAFLGKKIETRENCVNELIENSKRLNGVAYKHTYEFYLSLREFCQKYFDVAFSPADIKFGKDIIKANELTELYSKTYKTKSPAVRVEWIVDYIMDKLNINVSVQEISERLKKIIYPFFTESNILKIYADFLTNIGMQFQLTSNGEICFDDLASLLYIYNYFFGIKKRKEVKYLIIDEMQDYSFVHYDIFNSIFDCNKIVLGDINQCIEKIITKNDLEIIKKMLNAEYLELNTSYRSTYEITDFACKIKEINCKKIERHGNYPKLIKINKNNINNSVKNIINNSEKYNSIAILTKTEQEAKEVYVELLDSEDIALILNADEELKRINIMPSYIAKGLEFDVVVIPNYSKKQFNTFLDNNLLYVACTRALHELYLLSI